MDGKGSGILRLNGMKFSERGEGVLLRYLSEMLGFSYSVRLIPYQVNGDTFNQQEQLLVNNTVDMAVNSLTHTVRRFAMMQLSFPVNTYLERVAIPTPRLARRPFEPNRPFTSSAWAGVAFLLSLISLLMAGCQNLAIFSGAERRNSFCRREASFLSSWWTLAAMSCLQYGAGFSAPTRPSRAVLGFCCFIFTFLVSSYYSSVIHSFMALERPQLPYSSVRHGVETGRLRVGYPKGGVIERTLLSTRDPLVKMIVEGERHRQSHVDFWSRERDQLGAWLHAGPHHGFLISGNGLEAHRAIHGDGVCLLPELMHVRHSGPVYSRQFSHSRLLNLHLLKLRELGLLQRVAGKTHRIEIQSLCQLDAKSGGWEPLGLGDLSAVFALVPAGAAAALLVLAAERMVQLITRGSAVETEMPATQTP